MNCIPCTFMRGGSSRGLFFLEEDLPQDETERNSIISRIFGSPDPTGLQINGLGGTTATKNKSAIISRRAGELNTVNYNFGQVYPKSWLVDRHANCGNMSSAVGPFAIDNGLVDRIESPVTIVRIFNTNTQKYIVAHVPVKEGKTLYEGDFRIAGVNQPGSRIRLDFLDPGGPVTGRLLPTGQVRDVVHTEHYGDFAVSIVDAANPFVFVRAEDFGVPIEGYTTPALLNADDTLVEKGMEIRDAAALLLGFAKDLDDARQNSPALPKLSLVGTARNYESLAGQSIDRNDVDLLGYMYEFGRFTPGYALTGAICLSVAARIEGTVVEETLSKAASTESRCDVRIGQPSGIIPVQAEVIRKDGDFHAVSTTLYRTARILMKGLAYYI